jgi:hypothetical protein
MCLQFLHAGTLVRYPTGTEDPHNLEKTMADVEKSAVDIDMHIDNFSLLPPTDVCTAVMHTLTYTCMDATMQQQ